MANIAKIAAEAAGVRPSMALAAVIARLRTLRDSDPRAIGDGLIDWRNEVTAIRQHALLIRRADAALRALDPAGEWFAATWAEGVRLGAEYAAGIDGSEADVYEVATSHVLATVASAVWPQEGGAA